MPRMDGLEMLRLIMRSAPLPVILFSTHSKEGGYATLKALALGAVDFLAKPKDAAAGHLEEIDRKSTRLNSSHSQISYAVFCLKKKNRCDVSSTNLHAILNTTLA